MLKRNDLFLKAVLMAVVTLSGGLAGVARAQIAGGSVVNGDLDVGTVGNPGTLEVTGPVASPAAPGLIVTGAGGVIFEGTNAETFLWYPGRAALRAGAVSGTQ